MYFHTFYIFKSFFYNLSYKFVYLWYVLVVELWRCLSSDAALGHLTLRYDKRFEEVVGYEKRLVGYEGRFVGYE